MQQLFPERRMHSERFTEHENGIRLSESGGELHLVKEMIDEGLQDGEGTIAEEGLGWTDNIDVGYPQNLDSVGAVAIDKLLIERIRSGVRRRVVRMRRQSLLFSVQFNRIAEYTERTARPWNPSGRELRQFQRSQPLSYGLVVGLGAPAAAARNVLRLHLLGIGLPIVLRNAKQREVSSQAEVRRYHPRVLITDLNDDPRVGSLHAVPLTRVTAAVTTLWKRHVLAQRYHHVKTIAHRFETHAQQLQTLYVRKFELYLRDQLEPFHFPEKIHKNHESSIDFSHA